MWQFLKRLDLFDKIFFVLFVSLAILSAITGDWRGVIYTSIFALFILLLASKDMIIRDQSNLIDRVLEVAELATNALGGRKIVRTKTIEFSVERSKKSDEKPSNEDKANAGRSRSSSSRKRSTSKTANASRTGTASVSNRKPKATKKNSEA